MKTPWKTRGLGLLALLLGASVLTGCDGQGFMSLTAKTPGAGGPSDPNLPSWAVPNNPDSNSQSEPFVPQPSGIRLLTSSQLANSLQDLFGADITFPAVSLPLGSIGAATAGITDLGV